MDAAALILPGDDRSTGAIGNQNRMLLLDWSGAHGETVDGEGAIDRARCEDVVREDVGGEVAIVAPGEDGPVRAIRWRMRYSGNSRAST